MKKILLCIGSLITITAQAHFFAYKEWYNPTTGQILEMYYDVHQTDNESINPRLQQKAFMKRAQQHDCYVITEDLESFYAKKRGELGNQSSKRSVQEMIGEDSLCPSPLSFLCARCFVQDILWFNAECRPSDDTVPLDKEYLDEIDAYSDGAILDNFYDSIEQYAYELDCSKQKTETNFLETCLSVDARMLHEIYSITHKHLMLATGASHIIRISTVLPHLGWQVKKTVISKKLTTEQQQDLAAALKGYSGDTPVDANFRWNHYLHKYLTLLTSHSLNLDKIPPHELIGHSPEPDPTRESPELVTETFRHLANYFIP